MRHFGIIGYPLVQSFSAKYFNEKFARESIDAEYSLYPLDNEQWTNGQKVRELIDSLDGMNVTIPYKQAVIPFLERLDETAQAIGAVNVIHRRVGYNTDCLGFIDSIRPLLRAYDRKALVLGTGGASKAVCYGLRKLGVSPTLVSRTPNGEQLGYSDLTADVMAEHTIIVNCTPLGMYPDTEACPDIPYEQITARHLLFDCIYNPEQTLFLRKGQEQGAQTKNGMEMLFGQAKAAWAIWTMDDGPLR